jgi:hypothetical protein
MLRSGRNPSTGQFLFDGQRLKSVYNYFKSLTVGVIMVVPLRNNENICQGLDELEREHNIDYVDESISKEYVN